MEHDTKPQLASAASADMRVMKDRRASWRGGRRNNDWFNRPIGAWRGAEKRLSPWRVWVASWPLHHLRDDRRQGR